MEPAGLTIGAKPLYSLIILRYNIWIPFPFLSVTLSYSYSTIGLADKLFSLYLMFLYSLINRSSLATLVYKNTAYWARGPGQPFQLSVSFMYVFVMDAAVLQVSKPVWNSRHYDSALVQPLFTVFFLIFVLLLLYIWKTASQLWTSYGFI